MRASLKAALAARIVACSLVIAGPALGTPVDGLNLAPSPAPDVRLPNIHASLLWSAPMRILPLAAPEQSADGILRARYREKKKPKVCRGHVD